MRQLVRNYSLSLVLLVLFLVAWVAQTVFGWFEFRSEQRAHLQAAQLFGADGYVWNWARATMENWQSEFLQLVTFVVLTSFLIHKGSAESKDGDEEIKQAFARLEQRLDAMQPMSPHEAHHQPGPAERPRATGAEPPNSNPTGRTT